MEDKTLRTKEEIDAVLVHLTGWRRDGEFLKKDFVFNDFSEINAFLPYFSETIAKQNHHPDFEFVGGEKRLSVEVTTHSAGCVTQADLMLAAALNAWREE